MDICEQKSYVCRTIVSKIAYSFKDNSFEPISVSVKEGLYDWHQIFFKRQHLKQITVLTVDVWK